MMDLLRDLREPQVQKRVKILLHIAISMDK